jgi:FtsZ-interacting cell division protein ZipA
MKDLNLIWIVLIIVALVLLIVPDVIIWFRNKLR